MYQTILNKVKIHESDLISLRRAFHRIPETAWKEHRTTAQIAENLLNLGYDIHINEKATGNATGVVAQLNCGKGPVIALRFDIDGLANQESQSDDHLPNSAGFSSTIDGYMHACGHDGHIAIGLGCAAIFSEIKDKLCGTIRLLFQPAEEGCMGGRAITEVGWLDDVDYFLAGHIVPRLYIDNDIYDKDISDTWDIVPVSGSLATTKLNAFFTGRSCHGATPENGCSVIPAIASAVLALNGISRNSQGSTFLNIGKIAAGEGRNILAEHGSMELEVRGETTALNQYMEDAAVKILKGQEAVYSCQVDIDILGSSPSLVSSPELYKEALQVLDKYYNGVINPAPMALPFRASEDASIMMERVKSHGGKAAYFLLPTDANASLHKPDYDFDEQILSKAVTSYCACTYSLLHE